MRFGGLGSSRASGDLPQFILRSPFSPLLIPEHQHGEKSTVCDFFFFLCRIVMCVKIALLSKGPIGLLP